MPVKRCIHAIGICGECRHREATQLSTVAELEARIAQYRSELAELHKPANGKAAVLQTPAPPPAPVITKLDLGCGTKKQPGFHGVDTRQFTGVDTVVDLGKAAWPWPDNSVEETYCAQMLEHVPGKEVDWELADGKLIKKITYPRAHFFNELWRVLKPGGRATFITPYWCSCRAYGDITHEWPPVGEMFWFYLDKNWRKDNAPHDDMYTCDFTGAYALSIAPHLVGRNDEFRNDALRDHKEAATDLQATVTARK